MSKRPKKGWRLRARWRATNGYLRFGAIATCAVVLASIFLAFGMVSRLGQPDTVRWKAFFSAEPNEIGDTIAGLAGTLAFLWIIVTVMIQGSELRLQRRELAMTRRELKAQREASEEVARAMTAQSDLLNFQLTTLEQNKARDNLERSLGMLQQSLYHLRGLKHWEHLTEGTETNVQTGETKRTERWEIYAPEPGGGNDVDAAIQGSLESLRWFKQNLEIPGKIRAREGQKSAAKSQFEKILPSLDVCLRYKPKLNEVEMLRLERLELSQLEELVNWFLRCDLWDPNGRGKERFTQ